MDVNTAYSAVGSRDVPTPGQPVQGVAGGEVESSQSDGGVPHEGDPVSALPTTTGREDSYHMSSNAAYCTTV